MALDILGLIENITVELGIHALERFTYGMWAERIRPEPMDYLLRNQ